ncbi:MAG: ABC transporter permease subunit [Symbiobacteriia bacterium]
MDAQRRPSRSVWAWVISEAAWLVVMALLVIVIAARPSFRVYSKPTALFGVGLRLNLGDWWANVGGYLHTLASGSLGENYKGYAVGPLLVPPLLHSLTLLGLALVLATLIGIAKGLWDFRSMQRRRLPIAPLLTSAVQGMPDFWVVLLLQLFAVWIYKASGWKPFRVAYASEDPVTSMILPLITLSLIPASYVARVTSLALKQVYDKDYIRTARSKGLAEGAVLLKHAFRNALVQILDGMPGVVTVMVSNLLIVEYMYGYPGITEFLRQAIRPPVSTVWRWSRLGPVGPAPRIPDSDVPSMALAGISIGAVFSLLFLTLGLVRRLIDPRLKERDQA